MTPPEARDQLRAAAAHELPTERRRPPVWAPFRAHHRHLEVLAAAAAARTRRDHLTRLAGLTDGQLSQLILSGWDPRDRGLR